MKIIRNFIVAALFASFVCGSTANAAENTGGAISASPQHAASNVREGATIGMLDWLINQLSANLPSGNKEITCLRGLKAPPLW
jgi:hypothetical protein